MESEKEIEKEVNEEKATGSDARDCDCDCNDDYDCDRDCDCGCDGDCDGDCDCGNKNCSPCAICQAMNVKKRRKAVVGIAAGLTLISTAAAAVICSYMKTRK